MRDDSDPDERRRAEFEQLRERVLYNADIRQGDVALDVGEDVPAVRADAFEGGEGDPAVAATDVEGDIALTDVGVIEDPLAQLLELGTPPLLGIAVVPHLEHPSGPPVANGLGRRTFSRLLRLGPAHDLVSCQSSPAPTSTASGGSSSYAPHISSRTRSFTAATSFSGASSRSSSWICSTSRAARPSSRSRRWIAIIATLMMSAFEPCMTKLTASRSPSERVCRFDARSSGTGRRRPSNDVV